MYCLIDHTIRTKQTLLNILDNAIAKIDFFRQSIFLVSFQSNSCKFSWSVSKNLARSSKSGTHQGEPLAISTNSLSQPFRKYAYFRKEFFPRKVSYFC